MTILSSTPSVVPAATAPVDPSVAIRRSLAETGRGYQPQFISMVSSLAYNTVIAQLKRAGVPDQVIDLLDMSIVLGNYAGMLRTGTITDTSAADITDTLPIATRLIWDLGGEFTDGESAWAK